MSYFDAGIFLVLIAAGFVCLLSYRKVSPMLLIMSILSFMISGLLIVVGQDVASFTLTTDNHGNIVNQTTYFIGNGGAVSDHAGQLLLGYVFVVLGIISMALLLDSLLKGQFFSAS